VIDLLTKCERLGIRLELQDDRVVCLTPRREVPDDLAEGLREHKSEILTRLQCDRIIRETLDAVNDVCPIRWSPTPGDWCRLDEIQLRIDAARDRGDIEMVRWECRNYEQEAQQIFRRWTASKVG